jgi:hypothetical protein
LGFGCVEGGRLPVLCECVCLVCIVMVVLCVLSRSTCLWPGIRPLR